MGISNSKVETCKPLGLCKERKKFIKQAIDSRYNLAAAHVVYIQSLHNIGIALSKFAETEFSLEQSHPPPRVNNGNSSKLSYMKSNGVSSVTVNLNLNPSGSSSFSNKVSVDDVESLQPPPPPPPRFSWDYFEPSDGSFRLMGHNRFQNGKNVDDDLGVLVTPPESLRKDQNGHFDDNVVESEVKESDLVCKNDQSEECDSLKDGCLTEQESDDHPVELIAHRTKDFLSSIKEIENHFIRASKSGYEVSRMLEANKIQVSYSEARGSSTGSSLSFLTCFRGENALVLYEPQQTTKVITWKRSTSLNSSLSNLQSPPTTDDKENNFMEEFCMIAGSHSSTLERVYAWERKLYDEVKASESIRKEYDRKCDELRHQFTKDIKPHLIDKNRAVAKDLHSRLKVALHTVDSISKRIEKMRDEELQPQLLELIHGLIRMWKSILECHRTQHITISLAYDSKTSKNQKYGSETKNQIMSELQHETERFGSSFSDLVKCYNSYIDSINSWLQNCIVLPKERVRGRRVFSPRRAVAPPIFVISRDWSNGLKLLPSQKLSDAIKDFSCQIRRLYNEEFQNKEISLINREEMNNGEVIGSSLSKMHSCLTKVLDRLTEFSESSLMMYEDIKVKCETAENVYSNYKPPNRAFSI
uniref:protein ROLLING AND ERECT LEAF 2-like n=1 Tax=Erigeron canadensis TaxID=72917 RepID=UPI001CB9C361|nr:protein ROLLING AND ERECT LEAF 2-like [Erigeron canadensis]